LNAPWVSSRQLRDTLGLFASGVVVVTSLARSGERLGLTVSSFSSLSLEPPLILFSINRHARSFPAWETAEHFAVNVLAEHQGALSTRFARALIDKWVDLDVGGDQYGSPTLPGALAVLSCSTHQRFDGGDHMILVGRVDALAASSLSDPRPLIFFAGAYRRLDSEFAIQTPAEAAACLQGW
jgi:flavin reductase (DIM6/NTAB) family NADH-FMN oxidoreductase RutF